MVKLLPVGVNAVIYHKSGRNASKKRISVLWNSPEGNAPLIDADRMTTAGQSGTIAFRDTVFRQKIHVSGKITGGFRAVFELRQTFFSKKIEKSLKIHLTERIIRSIVLSGSQD